MEKKEKYNGENEIRKRVRYKEIAPASYPIRTAPSAGIKRPGREADHSLATSFEVNNMLTYTSTPLYVCMA
jgi:hypothetical protein